MIFIFLEYGLIKRHEKSVNILKKNYLFNYINMFKKGLICRRIISLHNMNPELVEQFNNRKFYIEIIKMYYCKDKVEQDIIERILSKCPMQGDITRLRNLLAKENLISKVKNYKKEKEIRDEYSPINNLISSMKRWFHF